MIVWTENIFTLNMPKWSYAIEKHLFSYIKCSRISLFTFNCAHTNYSPNYCLARINGAMSSAYYSGILIFCWRFWHLVFGKRLVKASKLKELFLVVLCEENWWWVEAESIHLSPVARSIFLVVVINCAKIKNIW